MTAGQLLVCDRCKAGKHSHDRWTDSGADAGCPFLVDDGNGDRRPCECPITVHQAYRGERPHCPTCTCHVATDPGGTLTAIPRRPADRTDRDDTP